MARGPRTTRHKNITRIDHPAKHTFGYNVRVTWKGQKYGKFFSDSVYGDRLAALDAAIAWRDETERKIGKPRTEHQVVGWHSRNKTGVVGIRRRWRGSAEIFEVTWMVRGDRPRKAVTSYSITRHGEKKAFRLALRARQRGERLRWNAPRIRHEAPKNANQYKPWMPQF